MNTQHDSMPTEFDEEAQLSWSTGDSTWTGEEPSSWKDFCSDAPENDTSGKMPSEEDDEKRYPKDCYSFLALNGPSDNSWPLKKVMFFLFGLMPFLFQMPLLGLFFSLVDKMDYGEDSDSCPHKRIAQVISLLVYLVFPNSTLHDVIKAVQLFPWSSKEKDNVPVGCIRISCVLRGIQSNCAIMTVFLLVMTSANAYDIILNFTAVNFISDLDEAAFSLARSGMFGLSLKEESKRIERKNLPACSYRESKHVSYGIVVLYTAATLFGLMMVGIMNPEKSLMSIKIAMRVQFAVGFSLLFLCIACSTLRCCVANIKHWFCPNVRNQSESQSAKAVTAVANNGH